VVDEPPAEVRLDDRCRDEAGRLQSRPMSVLQFSLFFLAILVGYFLLHLRLVRFEEHLQKLAGIRSMDDRLRGLDDRFASLIDGLGRLSFDRLEARLDRLHEDLEDLREATTSVRQAVVQIPTAPPVTSPGDAPVAPVSAPAENAGARIRSLVETCLLQLGYGNLDILTDLGAARADQDLEVQVECERNGMPSKGRVFVRNGSIRDVALQTVAPMFP